MTMEFRLPELGENIEEAEVAELLVQEGDVIAADQPVMELETEKAVVELPCPYAGRITQLHVKEGETIKVGAPVLTIEPIDTTESAATEAKKAAPDAVEPEEASPPSEPASVVSEPVASTPPTPPTESPPPPPTAPAKSDKATELQKEETPQRKDTVPPPAGPATRLLARRLGVDLHQVRGSGPGGRILQEDVEAFVREKLQAESTSVSSAGLAAPPLPDFSKYGPVERESLSRLQRTAIQQLTTSWRLIPHVTQHDLADVTALEEARRRHVQQTKGTGPKITVTAIVVKAVAMLLREFPRFNASLDEQRGELILKRYYHIGVAVDTPAGLVVPVIRQADTKTLRDIAAELTELADKARNRKLSLQEMEGATFTISNLGGIGGTAFTPIVNYPEVAILGMSRTQKQLVLQDGTPQERLLLPLSLSYDHRVINGADAARFVVRLCELLREPFELLFGC